MSCVQVAAAGRGRGGPLADPRPGAAAHGAAALPAGRGGPLRPARQEGRPALRRARHHQQRQRRQRRRERDRHPRQPDLIRAGGGGAQPRRGQCVIRHKYNI